MTIAVDFDGVIHAYRKGWSGGEIYDEPVEGVVEALKYLKSQNHKILIFSTRSNSIYSGKSSSIDQNEEMKKYLNAHGIPFDQIWKYGKPMADIYIDDRAIQFKGDWQETLTAINSFKPWNR